ncbi:hypothetical protein [Nocardioides sp. SYSU D00038]|nr:hypothetical protein [Nocardioides sp. SYSU D00038]
MNKIVRKISIVVAAAAVSVGLLGVSAPAEADSSWGWVAPQKSSWGW